MNDCRRLLVSQSRSGAAAANCRWLNGCWDNKHNSAQFSAHANDELSSVAVMAVSSYTVFASEILWKIKNLKSEILPEVTTPKNPRLITMKIFNCYLKIIFMNLVSHILLSNLVNHEVNAINLQPYTIVKTNKQFSTDFSYFAGNLQWNDNCCIFTQHHKVFCYCFFLVNRVTQLNDIALHFC